MAKAFDPRDFWKNDKDARKEYVDEPVTPARVRSVEKELGFKLPRAYVALMRVQNGGYPKRTTFPTKVRTSWAEDHIAITGFFGIGRKKPLSLLGPYGSRFAQETVGYPTWGICICDCPSAGHDMVMLDYRKCGPRGEPAVVHVDQEMDYRVTKLAPDFATFVRGLVADEDELDEAANDAFQATRRDIERGRFSTELTRLLKQSRSPKKTEKALRYMLDMEAITKGKLVLDGGTLSYLIYDLLFWLYTSAHPVRTPDEFLAVYGSLLEEGDGDVKTVTYRPRIVATWMKKRVASREIIEKRGTLTLSAARLKAVTDAIGTTPT